MPRTEAVLFDLDDTLVRYERSPGEVLLAAFEAVGCDPLFSVEEYYARYDEFAEKCDSMDELRSECFAALAESNGYERRRGRAVAAAFSEERDQTRVELLPSVGDVLGEVSSEYRTAIVTNGARDAQHQKIDAVGLDRWVDEIVVAGHDVPPKPDPEPFERAIRTLGVTPESTVHVGDSPDTDVAGASAAGLDTVLVAEGSAAVEPSPTYRIESIDALRSLPWLEESASGHR